MIATTITLNLETVISYTSLAAVSAMAWWVNRFAKRVRAKVDLIQTMTNQTIAERDEIHLLEQQALWHRMVGWHHSSITSAVRSLDGRLNAEQVIAVNALMEALELEKAAMPTLPGTPEDGHQPAQETPA